MIANIRPKCRVVLPGVTARNDSKHNSTLGFVCCDATCLLTAHTKTTNSKNLNIGAQTVAPQRHLDLLLLAEHKEAVEMRAHLVGHEDGAHGHNHAVCDDLEEEGGGRVWRVQRINMIFQNSV